MLSSRLSAPLDPETREILSQISSDLPRILNGDSKAINTSASVFNYLNDWSNIIKLADAYPLAFKQDSRLSKILSTARSELNKIGEAKTRAKTPVSNIKIKPKQETKPVKDPQKKEPSKG